MKKFLAILLSFCVLMCIALTAPLQMRSDASTETDFRAELPENYFKLCSGAFYYHSNGYGDGTTMKYFAGSGIDSIKWSSDNDNFPIDDSGYVSFPKDFDYGFNKDDNNYGYGNESYSVGITADATFKNGETVTIEATLRFYEEDTILPTAAPPSFRFDKPNEQDVFVGNTIELKLSGYYGGDCFFASSDESIAKIDSYGYHVVNVTLLKPGKVTIAGLCVNGYSILRDSITLDIKEPTVQLESPDKSVLYVGGTGSISHTILNAAKDSRVVWECSDPSAISIDPDGYYTFNKAGEFTVTAYIEGFEEYKNSITLNIQEPFFRFKKTAAKVKPYSEYQIPIEAFGVDKIEWAASNPLVTVDSEGKLNAFIKSGEVSIVAKAYLKNQEMVVQTFTLTVTNDAEPIYGDINSDGDISVSDLLLMNKYIVRIITGNELDLTCADMNKDGLVNVLDVVILKRSLL